MLGMLFMAGCISGPITQLEARTLALLVPDAIAARRNGYKLAAQWGEIEGKGGLAPGKRVVRVFATNSSSTSSLLGYYAVDPYTAVVTYAISDLGTEPLSDPELERARQQILGQYCARWNSHP